MLTSLAASVALADTVIAARTVPARSIVSAVDLSMIEADVPGALTDPTSAIGLEAKVTLYQGRPVLGGHLGPPALVERNEIVVLHYDRGGLRILTDGRVLDRAGAGDRVRVMNLASRITVIGTVIGPGAISVR
ncbi:MAG: flagellar basal body P-ring formation chaperone FlgA [Pseudomonadota bacterium]